MKSAQQKTETAVSENLTLIQRYFEEVWNQGNLDLLDELVAENYINHSPGGSAPVPGPEGLKPIVAAVRQAFSDLHYSIMDTIIIDEKIVARVKLTGTHDGNFFGTAPTGKRIDVDQINIEHVQHGKIIAHWRITDNFTMMKQMGVL
jgi:steroid delta-isomerase-like uncharacterized protein